MKRNGLIINAFDFFYCDRLRKSVDGQFPGDIPPAIEKIGRERAVAFGRRGFVSALLGVREELILV